MQPPSTTVPLSYLDQWHAYQIRAFGPLYEAMRTRTLAMLGTGRHHADFLARKIRSCCRHPVIITVDDGLHYYLAEQRCKSRVCPRCSRIRARQLAVKIAAIVRRMDAPRFLTLTMRSTDRPLRDQITHLRRRFAAMRRTESWKRHVGGGVYTIEITFNAETSQWHPHLHAIIDGSFYPHRVILADWETAVGDHAGVDIRAVHGIRKLANYLAAYVAKSCDLTKLDPDRLAEWAVETHGLRLAQTFGSLQNCKPQTDDLEPLPTRMVEIDVNQLAYDASFGHTLAEALLQALEPRRGRRPDQYPAGILHAIHRYNNPPSHHRKRPRGRDPNQLPLLKSASTDQITCQPPAGNLLNPPPLRK